MFGQAFIVYSLNSPPQVMLAASYWSLLAPAIEMAEDSRKYGAFAFLPVAIGFVLGAAFVYFADLMMPFLVSGLFVLWIRMFLLAKSWICIRRSPGVYLTIGWKMVHNRMLFFIIG